MLNVKKIAIWSTELEDQPGATTGLFRALAEAGANLEFALARRQPDKPGKGILFISPIRGNKQEEAARHANFELRSDVVGVSVEGPNKAGLGYQLTQALANGGLNLRALIANVIGNRAVMVFAFDTDAAAEKAVQILSGIK